MENRLDLLRLPGKICGKTVFRRQIPRILYEAANRKCTQSQFLICRIKTISFQLVLRIIRLGDHSVRANPTASKDIFPCCILLIYLSCEAQNPRPFGRGVLSLPAIRVPALCRRPVQPTGTFNVICLFLFPTVRKFLRLSGSASPNRQSKSLYASRKPISPISAPVENFLDRFSRQYGLQATKRGGRFPPRLASQRYLYNNRY